MPWRGLVFAIYGHRVNYVLFNAFPSYFAYARHKSDSSVTSCKRYQFHPHAQRALDKLKRCAFAVSESNNNNNNKTTKQREWSSSNKIAMIYCIHTRCITISLTSPYRTTHYYTTCMFPHLVLETLRSVFTISTPLIHYHDSADQSIRLSLYTPPPLNHAHETSYTCWHVHTASRSIFWGAVCTYSPRRFESRSRNSRKVVTRGRVDKDLQ